MLNLYFGHSTHPQKARKTNPRQQSFQHLLGAMMPPSAQIVYFELDSIKCNYDGQRY
jgi:hypothetical protein